MPYQNQPPPLLEDDELPPLPNEHPWQMKILPRNACSVEPPDVMAAFISLGIPAFHPPVLVTLNTAHPLGPVSTLRVALFVNGSNIVRFSVVGGPLKLKLCVVRLVTFAPMSGVSGLAYVKAHALTVMFLESVAELVAMTVEGAPSLRFPRMILMTVLLVVWLPSTL